MFSNHEIFVRCNDAHNNTTAVRGYHSFVRGVAFAIQLHTEMLKPAANLLADRRCVFTDSACEHDCVHAAKHGCAMSLISKLQVNEVQTWLGHKSGASTMIYLEVSEAQAAESVVSSAALV